MVIRNQKTKISRNADLDKRRKDRERERKSSFRTTPLLFFSARRFFKNSYMGKKEKKYMIRGGLVYHWSILYSSLCLWIGTQVPLSSSASRTVNTHIEQHRAARTARTASHSPHTLQLLVAILNLFNSRPRRGRRDGNGRCGLHLLRGAGGTCICSSTSCSASGGGSSLLRTLWFLDLHLSHTISI